MHMSIGAPSLVKRNNCTICLCPLQFMWPPPIIDPNPPSPPSLPSMSQNQWVWTDHNRLDHWIEGGLDWAEIWYLGLTQINLSIPPGPMISGAPFCMSLASFIPFFLNWTYKTGSQWLNGILIYLIFCVSFLLFLLACQCLLICFFFILLITIEGFGLWYFTITFRTCLAIWKEKGNREKKPMFQISNTLQHSCFSFHFTMGCRKSNEPGS